MFRNTIDSAYWDTCFGKLSQLSGVPIHRRIIFHEHVTANFDQLWTPITIFYCICPLDCWESSREILFDYNFTECKQKLRIILPIVFRPNQTEILSQYSKISLSFVIMTQINRICSNQCKFLSRLTGVSIKQSGLYLQFYILHEQRARYKLVNNKLLWTPSKLLKIFTY